MLAIELRLPGCSSLKDKRAVVRPLLEGARRRFAVATAEVGHAELHQRASVGLAAVGTSAAHVEEVLDKVERFVWSHPELEVLDSERRWLEEP